MKKSLIRIISALLSLTLVYFSSAYYTALAFHVETVSYVEPEIYMESEYSEEKHEIDSNVLAMRAKCVEKAVEEKNDPTELSTQGSDEINFLKNYLMENGTYNYSSKVYFIASEKEIDGRKAEFAVIYFKKLDVVALNFYFYNDELITSVVLGTSSFSGYDVSVYFDDISKEVYGYSKVYPEEYPHNMRFALKDKNGNYLNCSIEDNEFYQSLFNRGVDAGLAGCQLILIREMNMSLGNLGFVAYEPLDYIYGKIEYTITYSSNDLSGVPAAQTKKHGKPIYISGFIPIRDGYKFLGWTLAGPNAVTPQYLPNDLFEIDASVTLYAVWTKVVQGDNPDNPYETKIRIVNNPGTLEVYPLSVIHLTAETENFPEGAYIHWYVNNNFDKPSDKHISKVVVTLSDIDVVGGVITIKAFDADGNPLLNPDGSEIMDSEIILAKRDFFSTIVGIFRKWFGKNEIYQ